MEDIFLREDSFSGEPWYNEFQMFLRIGVCCPAPEHIDAVMDALERMGYNTRKTQRGGVTFIVGA